MCFNKEGNKEIRSSSIIMEDNVTGADAPDPVKHTII